MGDVTWVHAYGEDAGQECDYDIEEEIPGIGICGHDRRVRHADIPGTQYTIETT